MSETTENKKISKKSASRGAEQSAAEESTKSAGKSGGDVTEVKPAGKDAGEGVARPSKEAVEHAGGHSQKNGDRGDRHSQQKKGQMHLIVPD